MWLYLLISLCIVGTVQQLESFKVLLAGHAQLSQPEGDIALLPNLLCPRDLVLCCHAVPMRGLLKADQLNLKAYALILRTAL